MLRLFAGISLPVLLRQRLTLLESATPGARWIKRENYHITLTFIGDIAEGTAEDMDEAFEALRAKRFKLRLKGAGCFAHHGDNKMLWIGVEESEPLQRLKDKIDRRLQVYKIPFEKRKYVPHVTVARLHNVDDARIAEFIQANNLFSSEEFEVDSFILYQSHLTKHGSEYEELKDYPLI